MQNSEPQKEDTSEDITADVAHDAHVDATADQAPSAEPAATAVAQSTDKKSRFKPSKKQIIVAIVVIFNIAVFQTGSHLFVRNSQVPATQEDVNAVADKNTAVEKPSTGDTSDKQTKPKNLHYDSNALKLSFDYPIDWRVGTSSGDKEVSLTSGKFDFKNSLGATEQGKIVLSIVSKDAAGTNFNAVMGDETATSVSEKIVYSNPSTVQRKQTNLSFLGHDAELANSSFNMMVITGDYSYKKGDPITAYSYKTIEPRITAYIDTCEDSCQAFNIGSISVDTWNSNAELIKLKEIIKTLRFEQ